MMVLSTKDSRNHIAASVWDEGRRSLELLLLVLLAASNPRCALEALLLHDPLLVASSVSLTVLSEIPKAVPQTLSGRM